MSSNYRVLAVSAATAILFSYALILTIIPANINEIGAFYHATPSMLGMFFWLLMAGFFVATLVGGRYSDRVGKFPVLVLGSSLMALGVFIFGRTSVYPVAVFASLVMGLGGGFSEGISMAAVADIFAGSRRTAVMNYSQLAFAVGAIVCPFAVTLILRAGGSWRLSFYGAAGICLLSTLAAVAVVFQRYERPVSSSQQATCISSVSCLKERMVLALSLGILLYVASESGAAYWLAAYFKNSLHAASSLASWTVALFWFGITVGRTIAAWISEHISDYALICWSFLLAAISMAGLLIVRDPIQALVFVFAVGFFMGSVWPTILSRAGADYPQSSGTVFAIIVAAGSLGGVFAAPVIGYIADGFGLRIALCTCVVTLVSGLALFLKLRSAA